MATVLVRRSQRARCAGRLYPLLYRWIPQPRVLHPYPDARFAATHPGKSRMRERARADLCGGATSDGRPSATKWRPVLAPSACAELSKAKFGVHRREFAGIE